MSERRRRDLGGASDGAPFARQRWFPDEGAVTMTPEARAPAVAQGAASGQRLVRRCRPKVCAMVEVPRVRTAATTPSRGRARRDCLQRRRPHEARVAPAVSVVAQGVCCKGLWSARRFRRPSITNSSDLVVSVASSDDDLPQSFVSYMRLLGDHILEFFSLIMMYDVSIYATFYNDLYLARY
jgi:hypothetical protein